MIRVLNGLDPNHDRLSDGSDLGPNCLKLLSVDDKSRRRCRLAREQLKILLKEGIIHGHHYITCFEYVRY